MKTLTVQTPDFLNSLASVIREVAGSNSGPVVVFSSTWPLLREMRANDLPALERLLDLVIDNCPAKTLLMPTFTNGFQNGVCNLDESPSTTGLLTERFRLRKGVRRTQSAFFSFGIQGSHAELLATRTPGHAWGPNSVYEWMEETNATFLMLGTHPTHCSFLHRIEWLAKERINYRFDKNFRGTLIHEGIKKEIEETLFVRRLDPPMTNDFTVLLPHLMKAGMRQISLNGVSIAAYEARPIRSIYLEALQQDPYLTVKNRKDFEVSP